MPRWTETWLTGLASAGVDRSPDGWRGRRLGLPPEGVGAIATTGSRVAAFAVDAIASGLVAAPFFSDPTDSRRGVAGIGVLALMNIVLLTLSGRTFGMRLIGIRVVPLGELGGRPPLLAASVRTALLCLLIPALIFDRDGRGLHDKASGTAVVKATGSRSFAADD